LVIIEVVSEESSPYKLRGLDRAAASLVGGSWARHKGGPSRGACSPQLVLYGQGRLAQTGQRPAPRQEACGASSC